MSCVDSAYDSQRSCDPVIYGESTLSDVDFTSLFAADASIEDDIHFFKDGFAAHDGNDDIDANGFTFDSMVDLDACQPPATSNSSSTHQETTHNENNSEDLAHYIDVYTPGHSFSNPHPSSQNASTSSAQQPFLGAPPFGSDGSGFATQDRQHDE